MKKLVNLILTLFMTTALFAQTDAKKLLAGTFDFATEESDTWKIIDPSFKTVDPNAGKYVFTGSFVTKIVLGLSRYDFTCTVAKNGDDFTVDLSDMCSYACDKNYKIVKKGNKYVTSAKVASEYAKQIRTEIFERMNSWSDEDYSANLSKAVTSPFILDCVANCSALVFKKFVKDYEIIGRPIKAKVHVTKVDEAPKYAEGYAYYVAGKALCGTRPDSAGIINLPTYATFMVYTNNDDVIGLTPAELEDGILAGGKSGSVYEINGTVKDVSQKTTGGLSIIQVNE